MQVDTLAHRIDGFIDACVDAGLHQVFVGLENINADNLAVVKKRQNKSKIIGKCFSPGRIIL